MLSTENPPSDLCEIFQQKSDDVDLLKPGLDYRNPPPKFSIRDYVFNTRGKDIANNWPFSPKNLHLCLKNGSKDVLPPFESLDSVRNPSFEERVNIENINSSGSCREKPRFPTREFKKGERSNTQSPAKKCRLIVKINNISESKPAEEPSLNTPSEIMASKVCPVCKTFSSSSNTTLNAHIDQCLSGESIKLTTNSKVIKHRIKPRKMRSMVDIYETALSSTLEDLDKRNGTNWASNMGLQSQDFDSCGDEGKKKSYSPVNIEEIDQESDVYIDSSGTKLRILSKLGHPPPNVNVNDSGKCKFVERDKGIKLLSTKKKKKHNNVHKLELQKNSLGGHSPKSCYPVVEVNDEDRTKSNDFGMIKPWVGSKRSGLKKINLELENQLSDRSFKNSRLKNVSSLGDRRNSTSISPISSEENLVLKRKECGFSSLRSKQLSDKKREQSRKESNSIHERLMGPPNSIENHAKNDTPHSFSTQDRRFSSLRSKQLSVRHAIGPKSKNLGRELLNFKNRRLRSDEEAIISQSTLHAEDVVKVIGENATLIEKDFRELMINRTRALKTRENIGRFGNTDERETTSESSETSTDSDSDYDANNIESFTSGSAPINTYNVIEEETKVFDDFVCDPPSTNGEAFVSFTESLDSSYQNLFTSDSYEMGGDEENRNYFVDVDPIPIPGPPGSFIPSPGRMESEEQLGVSSLTTRRLQSSDDGLGVVDMDSSDSPISAVSTVSNSFAGKSSSLHESQIDIAKERINLVEDSNSFDQIANREREINRNIEPCCCSRKDVSSQSGPFDYQDSQVLRRKRMNDDAVEGFPSPSPTNPVLRLMGKNLMVVNKDDNLSPQTRANQPSMMDHPNVRVFGENRLSNANEPNSFPHVLPARQFDIKIPTHCGPSSHPSTAVFSSMSFGGSKMRPNSCGGKDKEIIIIDDLSESERGLNIDGSRVANPFYSPRFSGVGNGDNKIPSFKGMDANLGCILEGSSENASLPSSFNMRSIYFSPRFS